MRKHLPDNRYISVESHSGQIWISSFNGIGVVVPLSFEDAEEIGLTMYRAARKGKRG